MLDLFLTIAEITLAMTPILLLALLFTRFARRWSAGCRYAIWCILLLRLAIPLNFSLPFLAIDLAPPSPEPMPQFSVAATPEDYFVPPISIDPSFTQTAYITDGIPDTAYIENTVTLPTVDVSLDPAVVLCWMWAIGAAVVLAYQAVSCLSSSARLRRWKLPATDERLLAALERAKSAVGLRRRVSLWLCPEVSSPMLRGLIRPEILLPHGDYTDDQLDAILRHELIHCRRGDLWWKLCGMLAAGLHFFNPLVWIAQKQQEIEMEQSCDDAVFRLGDVSRQAYGETMLAVAREGLTAHAAGLNTQFHASAKTLKRRFANILDSSAKRAGVWLIVLALVVAVVCGGLVSCREDAPLDTDEQTVIEAAMAAADDAWGFDVAYVSFDGDTATVSALYNPGGHAVRTSWADITLTCKDGVWTVTDGLDGKLNWRSIVAENGRRNARELKRTAEVEAMIRAVWPGENSLANYEAANHAYTAAADLRAQLEAEHMQYRYLQEQLNTLSQRSSMSAQKERNAVEEALSRSLDRIAAIRAELAKQHQMIQAILPTSLQNAAYPLAGGGELIDLTVPAQNAEPALELACSVGTPVLAVADGIVIAAGYDAVDGHFVLIDHGEGGFTRSCWLSRVSVAEGDAVKRGDEIGISGRSGHARAEGLRFVLSLGAHADDAQMLFFATDAAVLGDETTADTGFSITKPIAGVAEIALPVPYIEQLADGTVCFDDGVQYFAEAGAPVYAAAAGTVTLAKHDPALGYYVKIDHGGNLETIYVHLQALTVTAGQAVDESMQIGTVGTTGSTDRPYIGFTINENGSTVIAFMDYVFNATERTQVKATETTDAATTIAPTPVTTAPPVTPAFFSLKMPLLQGTYTVGIPFGWYENNGTRVFQKAASYPAEAGTPVFAAADGTVTAATYGYDLGNYVTIEHWDGYATTYAHLSRIAVGIEPGLSISQGTMIGQVGTTGNSTGNHLGFMLTQNGDYVDPASYIHFPLRPAYTYTLSTALPKLHSWTQMTNLTLTADTVSRLGSEYTAIDYVIGQLYGDDHKFGQYTLRPEQIIINGKTMDSVWELQYSSYESVLIAMEAGGGQMYFAEAVAPYRATAAVWYPIINGNTGSTLGKESYTASAVANAAPLFPEQVWFVKNEQYEVKLTGVATAKLEVPVVYQGEIISDMPFFTADMPLDGLMTRANKERLTAEYQTALGYLVKKYGEDHGFSTLMLSRTVFENYESVWVARKNDGSGVVVIAMTAGGESYLIGGPQSLTTGWFTAPRFSDADPAGDARLTLSTTEPLLPCDITFPLD